MATSFSPTRQDVERYRSLRAVNMALNQRIVRTIPPQAFDDIGEALGILHDGFLVFDSEDMTSVMMDCCLYDWFENGKNLIQRYAETHAAKVGTDERYLLQASLQAKYRILLVQSTVPGAGLYCQDVLNGGELFLMDLAFSQSFPGGNAALATRTIPLGEYSMTGGAALPINAKTKIFDHLRRIEGAHYSWLEGPGRTALSIVRACLAAGAADYIVYDNSAVRSKKSRREPRWIPKRRRRR
ncbi:MAG: hypothetical protein KIT09_10085 [Bryobacteraceae bacterium]|nr:hypothetical protein [Bryobacteraceae bacterium]